MASLSLDQIKERIEQPLQRSEIEKAVRHEERVKLHTQTVLEEHELGYGWQNFRQWVSNILPPDVFKNWIVLARPPFPTLELTETIFDELSKIFHGKNKFIKYEFVNSDYEADALTYLEEIKDSSFWSETGFETSKDAFNSYIVVDLPKEQSTALPEPYYYFLDANNVQDIQFVGKEIDWVIIREGENQFLYIDSLFYTRIIRNNSIYSFEETPHALGRCPVKDFMKIKRIKKNNIDAKSPLTNSIGELDWLLFFYTSKKYLDLYGPFPVYWKYADKDCSYSSVDKGSCHEGYMMDGSACPVCSKKKHTIGVGTLIEVEAPMSKDQADLRNPVGVLPADINSLEYCRTEIERLEKRIFLNCVGKGGEPNTDQAQNEKQIQGAFESKVNILNQFKSNFEEAEMWTKDTIFEFRYGDNYIRSTVNYGDDFYLTSVKDLSDDYKLAKESGRPQFELERKRDQIYSTENRNNPDELNRIKILEELEPWPDLAIQACKNLSFDQLYPAEFTVKVNFNSFIKRFEREQASITLYGSLLSFDTKINLINSKLYEYANEKLNSSRGASTTTEGVAA